MTTVAYRQTYPLLWGYSVSFSMEDSEGLVEALWEPHIPDDEDFAQMPSEIAEDLMREAYFAASQDFATTVATIAGRGVDLTSPGGQRVTGVPQGKH